MNVTRREDDLNDLHVLLVIHPGEDDSPMVSATLLVGDDDAGKVTDLPPDVENGPASPMPIAEVYCHTSRSFFDVVRCGDELMAFPTSPGETEDAEGDLLGHVGVDSGVVMIGDPCYGEGEKPGGLMDAIVTAAETSAEVCTPQGDLGGIVVPTAHGDGIFPVFAHRDGDGRIFRLTVEF